MADYEKRMRKKTIGRGFKGEKESFSERMKRLSDYVTKDKRAREATKAVDKVKSKGKKGTKGIGKAMEKFGKQERYAQAMKRVNKTSRRLGLSVKRTTRTKPGRVGGGAALLLPFAAEGIKWGAKKLQDRQHSKKVKRQDKKLRMKYKKKEPKKQKRFEQLMDR